MITSLKFWSEIRRSCLYLACILFLGACSSGVPKAPVEKRGHSAKSTSAYHVVRRGDTLYGIAWQYDVDYRKVASWNRIIKPYLIYPGQRLRVKGSIISAATATKPAVRAKTLKTRPAPPVKRQPVRTSQPVKARTAAIRRVKPRKRAVTKHRPKKVEPAQTGKITWRWPTKGRIVRRFSQNGNKGLDINGNLGQPVYAAASGKIVYSGSGLIGYGKLIIIKHSKSHLSAYGYNRRLLVKEGDTVAGGQSIAEMGRTGTTQARLHFEIRRDGKPVNPLRYLPRS